MKTPFRIAIACLWVSACAPLSIYYRPGVEVSRMQTDATQCEVKALRDAPVANQVRQSAPIYFPGYQYCNTGGCFYRPGYWVNGSVYTVDVNRDLRIRVQNMCMADKGYQPASIPRCPANVAAAAPRAQTRTLPTLNDSSCSILNDDGSWQIVSTQQPANAD